MNNPGIIRNKDFVRQIILFEGMKFGTISPTDIDWSIDFGGNFFVFGEVKKGNTPVKLGQRLHLENLVNRLSVPAVALIVRHDTEDDIELAKTIVSEFFYNGKWRFPEKPCTTFDAINFIKKCVA